MTADRLGADRLDRAEPPRPADLVAQGVHPPPGGDGPTFAEPWQASVFAMAVHLNERGVFGWPRFAAALTERLTRQEDYYVAWSDALVDVLAADDILTPQDVTTTEQRWLDAAARTPHGRPVTLSAADGDRAS